MPNFPIVDAHVHLYDPAAVDFPWMKSAPALDRAYLPTDFQRLSEGVEVEAMVFVEVDAAPDQHIREADWVADQIVAEPRLKGMVASMPLERGAAVEADLIAYSKNPIARGVRRLIERHHTEPGWALRDDFLTGLRLLPKYDFTFDLCLYHQQLGEVIELCRRCPEVSFVVDHIAKPGIRAKTMEPWRSDMRAIAESPNVSCKISGVLTEADHDTWQEADVVPYISHAIDCFGFDRVMFGGDWPVSELAAPYRRWVEIVDRVVADASAAERQRLYRDNARRFYRL